jgi:hypothetical protein
VTGGSPREVQGGLTGRAIGTQGATRPLFVRNSDGSPFAHPGPEANVAMGPKAKTEWDPSRAGPAQWKAFKRSPSRVFVPISQKTVAFKQRLDTMKS